MGSRVHAEMLAAMLASARTQQVSRSILSRGRKDGCPRRDRVHQRKGFRDHGSPSSRHEPRQICLRTAAMPGVAVAELVRSPNKRDEALDRSLE